jgi:hypothetical protein
MFLECLAAVVAVAAPFLAVYSHGPLFTTPVLYGAVMIGLFVRLCLELGESSA